jgi:basic membrane lipoprotein Med (substrate-binding protein (PBP1-ABC) superfamily)
VLASAVIDIPRAFVEVATEVKEGRFVSGIKKLGMKDGVITLEVNPRLRERIPADVWQKIEAARQSIVAGELKVPTVES